MGGTGRIPLDSLLSPTLWAAYRINFYCLSPNREQTLSGESGQEGTESEQKQTCFPGKHVNLLFFSKQNRDGSAVDSVFILESVTPSP